MILNELYTREPVGYQDTQNDGSQLKLGDLRKTRLTLRQIHKLRMMNDVRTVELISKLKLVRQQYQPPPQPPAF